MKQAKQLVFLYWRQSKHDFTNASVILYTICHRPLLSLIVSVIIISIFTKRIQARLKHMASAIKSAGEGDLTINVTDTAGDELSDLAGHFNKMREN